MSTVIPVTKPARGSLVSLTTAALAASMTIDLGGEDIMLHVNNTDAQALTVTVTRGTGPAASATAIAWVIPAGSDRWVRLPDSSSAGSSVCTLALTTTGAVAGTAGALAG